MLGILAAYFCNWALLRYSQAQMEATGAVTWIRWTMVDEVWRGMFGAEMIPAGLFLLLLLFVPESPRWLVQQGQEAQASHILTRVSGPDVAARELAEIRSSISHRRGTLGELFAPGLRVALLVGVGLSFFGQLSGVNIVVYYGPSILEQAGFAKNAAFLFQVGFGTINLIFTIVALFFIDRFGRRPLLIGGMAVVTVALAITGGLFLWGGGKGVLDPENRRCHAGDVSCVWVLPWCPCFRFIWRASRFSICAVIWVLTPEIFPNRVRGRAASIGTLTNWSTNALSVFWFPPFVAAFSMHAAFFTFAAICLVATVFFWKLVPETKGKSLEEIEQYWLERAQG